MPHLTRRNLLGLAAGGLLTSCGGAPNQPPSTLKIAMLHLEPQLGELDRNSDLFETAMTAAANAGAAWIMTPELGLTGYRFDLKIGTDWIKPGPDRWVQRLSAVASRLGVTLFLGHLELDASGGKRYNTVFVIGPDGAILGRHRKINTIPVSEAWSTRGPDASPVMVRKKQVGVLICADAWPPDHAQRLAKGGAEILISSATWPPEPHGPEKCWEQRTRDTGLPLFVCNRTGIERDFDIRKAESVVVARGQRLVRHASEHSSVLLVDWDLGAKQVRNQSVLHLDATTGKFRA